MTEIYVIITASFITVCRTSV